MTDKVRKIKAASFNVGAKAVGAKAVDLTKEFGRHGLKLPKVDGFEL